MSEIKEKVINIISEHLGFDKKKIKDNSDIIDDLGADSLDSVEIVMALEEEFDITILDAEAESIRTIEQITKLVEEKVKNG